jgi:pimeloyl-ACP methyl ester carboxylesterase
MLAAMRLRDMIGRASAAVDRGVLRFMERKMTANGPQRTPSDARTRLLWLAEQYRPALADPALFFPAPDAAEMVPTAGERRLRARTTELGWPSTYKVHLPNYREEHASHAANLNARARLYRGGDAPRTTVICIHGWGGGAFWLEERAFVVGYLLRIGLDVCLFQMPFHGERNPRPEQRSGALFPSSHVVRTNEAFGQAIHDLRALAAWLRSEGAPAVGVMGMSLGGYTTSLWASLDRELAFAVPMIPAVSMSALMWRHGEGSSARKRAERAGVSQDLLDSVFEIHSPLARPAAIDRERLLIIAGRADRITPPDQAEALWNHWGQPDIHWFPGGHLAQVGRGDAFRSLRRRLQTIGVL